MLQTAEAYNLFALYRSRIYFLVSLQRGEDGVNTWNTYLRIPPHAPSFTCGCRFMTSDGVSCHLCSQLTLGNCTSCSHCHMPFGQLCGFFIFNRYAWNVDDAHPTKQWVCRDLYNCSGHRLRRGWAPTGIMCVASPPLTLPGATGQAYALCSLSACVPCLDLAI